MELINVILLLTFYLLATILYLILIINELRNSGNPEHRINKHQKAWANAAYWLKYKNSTMKTLLEFYCP